MIKICKDKELIKSILTYPKVYPWVKDDGVVNLDNIVTNNLYYLWLVNEAQNGLVLLERFNSTTCSAHISVLPELWGRARSFVKDVIAWGFENTLYYKVVCFIPENNRCSLRLVQDLGFKKEGRLKKSILQDWTFYDEIIYSLFKEDVTWQAQ